MQAKKKFIYIWGGGTLYFLIFLSFFIANTVSLKKKKRCPVFLLQVLNNLWLLDFTRFLTGLKLVKYDFKCV